MGGQAGGEMVIQPSLERRSNGIRNTFESYNMATCKCDSPSCSPTAIVKGNDFTVVASLSVYDPVTEGYSPLDLSGAREVALNMVGKYSSVSGEGVDVSGSTVSARFPAGSLDVGTYGIEIIFRDSSGKGRLYERSLIAVVESGSDTTVKSSTERIISVDVRTRTIRLGGTGYGTLDGKPRINGVELVGDKTPAELGLVGSRAVSSVAVLTEEEYAALAVKDPSTLYVITEGGEEDEA